LDETRSLAAAQLKEVDFMKFQLNELHEAAFVTGEQKDIEGEVIMLEKADEITAVMEETKFSLMESESSTHNVIADIAKKWSEFTEADSVIQQGYEAMQEILDKISDVNVCADNMTGKIDSDPAKAKELRARLDSLYALQKKHGVQTEDALLEIQSTLEQKLSGIEGRGEKIDLLEKRISKSKENLLKIAAKLTSKRKKVFKKLENSVNDKLAALSMGSAQVKVSHHFSSELRNDGLDDISILFKANKGTDFQAIKKIASGGESARLMLSIKATVAHAMALPTMIFDEIDTGVSGEVAGKMGDILRELSQQHQLLCITHSPQVSARAVRHFYVYKSEDKKRTTTHVKILDKTERVTEIAKMLSGDPPSTFALDNAKDLITTK